MALACFLPPLQFREADPGLIINPGAVAHLAEVVIEDVKPVQTGIASQSEQVRIADRTVRAFPAGGAAFIRQNESENVDTVNSWTLGFFTTY